MTHSSITKQIENNKCKDKQNNTVKRPLNTINK